MSPPLQSWMEKAAGVAGVLACGARLADRSFAARSFRPDLPESRILEALRDVSEVAYSLQQNRLAAERLRWTFEAAQIRCLVLPGGVLGALIVGRETADLPECERLLAEFAAAAS